MSVVVLRLAWLVRRHLLVTVLFALVAGLTGGIALAAWSSARRTETVFDRFLRAADLPELQVTFCPPTVKRVEPERLGECLAYDASAELERIRGLPEVVGAARGAFRAGLVRPAAGGSEPKVAYIAAMLDPDTITPNGRPAVVHGRLAGSDAPDEVMVNEAFVHDHGLGLGDRMLVRPFGEGEDESTPDGQRTGEEIAVRIVGVVRTSSDLSAANQGDPGQVSAQLFTRPGVDRQMIGATLAYSAIFVQARGGDAVQAWTALERAFPDRIFNNQYSSSADDVVPVRDAYRYEADAARAIAVLTALAAVIFVGQALARQVRREWSDIGPLRAMGLSPRQAGLAAAGRGAVIGLGATVIAAALAVGLSGLTPVGDSRLAELDPGVQVDPLVLGLGLPLLVMVVVAMAWYPVRRLSVRSSPTSRRGVRLLRVPYQPPRAALAAGVEMAVNGGRAGTGLPVGTALIGVGLAAAALVGAAGLVASLDHLVATPTSFGATWDRSISSFQSGEPEGARDVLATQSGVERAAAFYGTNLVIGGESAWGVAFEPVDERTPVVPPAIIAGHAPMGAAEIALGALTMQQLHLRLGDSVEVATPVNGRAPIESRVVGISVVNATDEGSPGLGGVLSPESFHELSPEVAADIFVVDLADGAAGRDALSALESSFGGQLSGPVRQQAIRNLERLRALPWLLAGVVALLAAGSLAHALVLSVRRNRRQLAVFRTMGFTSGQVSAAVAWQASAFALAALVVGLPLGALLSRWGWRVISRQLGVATPALVPLPSLVLIAVLSLAFAVAVSFWPGRRAAHLRPTDALTQRMNGAANERGSEGAVQAGRSAGTLGISRAQEAPGMEVKELGHIVLYVRDLERSAALLPGRARLAPDHAGGGQPAPFPAAAFSAPSGRTHHELLLIEVGPDAAAPPPGRRVGLYHFGLKVGDSDDELRDALGQLKRLESPFWAPATTP